MGTPGLEARCGTGIRNVDQFRRDLGGLGRRQVSSREQVEVNKRTDLLGQGGTWCPETYNGCGAPKGHVSLYPGSLWCSHFEAKELRPSSPPGGASLPYLVGIFFQFLEASLSLPCR